MRGKSSDLPLARDASERFLPWLVGFLVYLAALSLTSAMVMHKLVLRWDRSLSGEVTIEVPPAGSPSEQALNEARMDQVMAILRETPGVTGAERYDNDRVNALLQPWLGGVLKQEDLPLPQLIAVTLDPRQPPDLPALARRIATAAPDAVLDDHQRWLGSLLSLARAFQLIAGGIVALVTVVAVLAVVFVTRTGLSIHRPVIEILHLIGARDAYIAAQFQKHALRLGLRGGLIGLMLAVATILPIGFLFERIEGVARLTYTLTPVEWILLACLPVLVAAAAMITARLTVIGTLARMP